MISVSFYYTIISLSKILGHTDLRGVCECVCVWGGCQWGETAVSREQQHQPVTQTKLLSLIILELEYLGWLTLANIPFTSSKILLSAFLMKKNLLFLAPKIHKPTFFRLKFYFFRPLKSTNLLFFKKSTSTFFVWKGCGRAVLTVLQITLLPYICTCYIFSLG